MLLLAGVGLLRGIFRPSCRFNDCKVVADFSALGKDDRGSAVLFLGKRDGVGDGFWLELNIALNTLPLIEKWK